MAPRRYYDSATREHTRDHKTQNRAHRFFLAMLLLLACTYLHNKMVPGNSGEKRAARIKAGMVLVMLANFALFLTHFDADRAFFEMASATSASSSTRRLLTAEPGSRDLGDADSSFSACLLVDEKDADKLVEWIAYHYFTMPLRYLVILQEDPFTSVDVLNRWKPYIDIVEWTYEDLGDGVNAPFAMEANEDDLSFQHRKQANFQHRCALHMHQNQRTMVSFHDINEYAAISSSSLKNAASLIQRPGSILRLLEDTASATQTSCVTTYVTHFGAVEASATSTPDDDAYANRFDTMKWRYAAKQPKPSEHEEIGNSFLDVSIIPALEKLAVSKQESLRAAAIAHRLFAPKCTPTRYRPKPFFRLHRYPNGVMAAASDAGSNKKDVLLNDDVRSWVDGFVAMFGEKEARLLLAE